MGFKAYYLFAKGLPREDVWKGLLLEPAPKPERVRVREQFTALWRKNLSELSDPSVLANFQRRYYEAASSATKKGERTIYGYVLLSGWYYIDLHMYSTNIFDDKALLPALSSASEIIFCSVHEGVMCSSASFWKNGEEVWHVEHNACNFGSDHLLSRGATPDSFPSVVANLEQKHLNQERQTKSSIMQGDLFTGRIDFFDAPLVLVENLTGFRHSRTLPTAIDAEPDYLKFRPDHPRPPQKEMGASQREGHALMLRHLTGG